MLAGRVLSIVPVLVVFVAAITVSLSPIGSASDSASDVSAEPGAELKRGAFFGAKLNPIPDEVRERLKLEAGSGAMIEQVIPGSSAEAPAFSPVTSSCLWMERRSRELTSLSGRSRAEKRMPQWPSRFAEATPSVPRTSRSRGARLRRVTITKSSTTRFPAAPAGWHDRHATQRDREASRCLFDPGNRYVLD